MVWAWIVKDPADREELELAITDIESSSDRSAAIVAAAFVEDHLAIALRSRLHQDEIMLRETFRSTGPLGSFAAKINFAFLMGLCSKEACKDLDTIKEIRNEFAHKVLTRDFNSQRVRDLANNLKFGEKFKITISSADDDSLPPLEMGGDVPTTPRQRYIKACQFFLMVFTMAKDSHPAPAKPQF